MPNNDNTDREVSSAKSYPPPSSNTCGGSLEDGDLQSLLFGIYGLDFDFGKTFNPDIHNSEQPSSQPSQQQPMSSYTTSTQHPGSMETEGLPRDSYPPLPSRSSSSSIYDGFGDMDNSKQQSMFTSPESMAPMSVSQSVEVS